MIAASLILIAATWCAPHDRLVSILQEQFHLSLSARGLASSGHVVEVWTGRIEWKMVAVAPSGQACVIVEGEYWILKSHHP